MTFKKERMILGKRIRRATGLKLPLAMRAAKLIHKGAGNALMNVETLTFAFESDCGTEGCCMNNRFLVGPKGRHQFFCY